MHEGNEGNQETRKPGSQESWKAGKQETTKPGSQEARKPGKPGNQGTRKPGRAGKDLQTWQTATQLSNDNIQQASTPCHPTTKSATQGRKSTQVAAFQNDPLPARSELTPFYAFRINPRPRSKGVAQAVEVQWRDGNPERCRTSSLVLSRKSKVNEISTEPLEEDHHCYALESNGFSTLYAARRSRR